jgi:Protein  of unknown function (DUF3018)
MPTTPRKKPVTPARRMSAYRARMKKAGLRPVQIWLPDTTSSSFIRAAKKQSLAIAAHDPAGDDILKWIDSVYEWPPA